MLSLNEQTQRIEPHRINGLLDMGVKPTFRLTTESGRTIRTTGNHPYLVNVQGARCQVPGLPSTKHLAPSTSQWIKVSELNIGDEIAVPKLQNFPHISKTKESQDVIRSPIIQVKKRVILESNSDIFESILESNSDIFESILESNSDIFESILESKADIDPERRTSKVSILRSTASNLRSIDSILFSIEPILPFNASNNWWCSSILPSSFPTFSITNSISIISSPILWTKYITQSLYLSSRFIENLAYADIIVATPLVDSSRFIVHSKNLNNEPRTINYKPIAEGNIAASPLGHRLWVIGHRTDEQRPMTNEPASEAGNTDILWDRIVSIEYTGYEQVYDIEVEGTHNFIANGIIAHNTYLSGNVGIGTTNPQAKLELIGTETSDGSAVRITNTTATTGKTWKIISKNNGTADIVAVGSPDKVIASMGVK